MRALLHPGSPAPALVDAAAGRTWSHAELAGEADALAARLATGAKELVFLRARVDAPTVVGYLGALAAGHAVALLDGDLDPELLAALVARYEPRFVLGGDEPVQELASAARPHPSLTVLLSTSGTTGSPKLVRLSAANVEANARSIAEYLGLDADERAVASLPFHYSYGLSVLNSHLLAGGSLVLPPGSLVAHPFWAAFDEHACTSFAGVPYSYALLQRIRWARRALPSLRTMTQAGGRLDPDSVLAMRAELAARGARFVVMYGATEATARMAWLPPERLEEKVGSIGVAIPGGRLDVDPENDELVYTGPNVMLGYAEARDDLARGDEQRGVLRTGDLGRVDADGFFYVTGRLKRFAKVYGLRINLDEVEREVRDLGPVAAVGRDEERITVFVERAEPEEVLLRLVRRFKLQPRTIDVRAVDALPTTSSGKVDYGALRAG